MVDNPWLRSAAQHHRGILFRSRGDTSAAEDLLHHALAIRAEQEFWPGVAGLARSDRGHRHRRRELGRRFVWPLPSTPGESGAGSAAGPSMSAACAPASMEPTPRSAKKAGRRRGRKVRLSISSRPSSTPPVPTARPASDVGLGRFTPTETEVVRLVAEGLTNPAIAARLFVSRATVKTHLVHVFSKLGVGSRAELATAAARRGA